MKITTNLFSKMSLHTRFVLSFFMIRNFFINFDSTWFFKRLDKVIYYKDTKEVLFKFKDGSETLVSENIIIKDNYPQWFVDHQRAIDEENVYKPHKVDPNNEDDDLC